MNFLLFGGLAYLLGSIPSAVWVGKSWFGMDVREHGSKNSGATNTFRVLGKKAGIIVLSMDVLKGVLAVTLPLFLLNEKTMDENGVVHVQLIAALCVVLGHVFPIFANFKGGKGVATSLGVIVGIHPAAAGICLALFLFVFIASNYVSLGAIVAAISFPTLLIVVFKITDIWLMIFAFLLGSAVIITHKKNIVRLLRGEESKMNLFKGK